MAEEWGEKAELEELYTKYKAWFEETTRLTPREQAYLKERHLEDKLDSVKFEFWRCVNSIVTSYFSILSLLKEKRRLEAQVFSLWNEKLFGYMVSSSETLVPCELSPDHPATSTINISKEIVARSEEDGGPKQMTQLEEGVMRFKTALVFSPDLVKTVQKVVFSQKNRDLLPGHSSLGQLAKEAKWFRGHKIRLTDEIDALKKHGEELKSKLMLPAQLGEGGKTRYSKWRSLSRVFKPFRKSLTM